jgi:NitT/TauT family transport system permease protein
MYAAIASVIILSALFLELLERIEVTLFRPERRAA